MPEESAAVDEPAEITATADLPLEESQCGGSWDAQDVELYDGTLGVNDAFVNLHEKPVGKGLMGCTGTLIARNLFLSAGHCEYEVGDTIRFNYQVDAETSDVKGDDFRVAEVVEQEDTLNFDYALLRLEHAPGDRYGATRISGRDPSGGELLTLIGHPDGVPKVITTGPESGAAAWNPANWFQHQADTLPGSSGSGVLDTNGRLIGVHTDGGCETSAPIEGNEALKMSALLTHSPTLMNLGSDSIWWSNGNDTFSGESVNVAGHFTPFAGDFDGDGDDDVFWYGRGGAPDRIWWFQGGEFTLEDVEVNGVYVPIVGNFDGDNDDDIFWYGPEGEPDFIWWSIGGGDFSTEAKTVSGDYIPFAGDFDGDDDDDIFWYGRMARADAIWWSTPKATPNGATFSGQTKEVNGEYLPVAGDFDADGDDDIFWYGAGSKADVIWWANGTSFVTENSEVTGHYLPCTGNFDGDDGDDIFWYAPGTASDYIWSSDGAGGFTTVPQTVSGQYYNVCGDFDEDGNTDVLWYASATPT